MGTVDTGWVYFCGIAYWVSELIYPWLGGFIGGIDIVVVQYIVYRRVSSMGS